MCIFYFVNFLYLAMLHKYSVLLIFIIQPFIDQVCLCGLTWEGFPTICIFMFMGNKTYSFQKSKLQAKFFFKYFKLIWPRYAVVLMKKD